MDETQEWHRERKQHPRASNRSPVGHNLFVGGLGKGRRVNDLSVGHENVEWLSKSRVRQRLDACHIEGEASKDVVDSSNAEERKHASVGTVTELTTLIHGNEFL